VNDPAAGHLTAAIDAIAAGADLLRSHIAPGADGLPVPRSDWGPLLYSDPVALAAVGEVARWARRGAAILDRLVQPTGGIGKLSVPVLAGASHWLAVLSDTALPGDESLAGEAQDREMLRAFPAAFPPGPVPVIGDERVTARYIQAPADRIHLLRNAYYLCAGASLRAATALDRLAASLGTSSRSLAIRRGQHRQRYSGTRDRLRTRSRCFRRADDVLRTAPLGTHEATRGTRRHRCRPRPAR
jgi:hypothetical protein